MSRSGAAAGPADDRSGDLLVERLTTAGHVLADRALCRDEQAEIEARLRAWIADPGVDVVVSTGGTGLTGVAFAGVDLALWDLRARRAGVSITALLGRRQESVAVYGSGVNLHYTLEEL